MRARPIIWFAAALLASACGTDIETGNRADVAFPAAGVARFVIAPPEDGPAWLPEAAFHVVFEGPEPTFGLVEPELKAKLVPLGPGEVTAGNGRFLGPVDPYRGWACEPCPKYVPLLAFDRLELAPVDTDGDGIADRLSGTFTVRASFQDRELYYSAEPFLARAEAEIESASIGTPRLLLVPFGSREVAVPDEQDLALAFELPTRIESARIVTSAGEVPVTSTLPLRTVTFWPEGLLPWGETATLVGEAQVLGAGAPLEPFAVPIPVLPRPEGDWSASFEDEGLAGLAVTHGIVTSADGSQGLPPLDGERFLLVEGAGFGLVFEVDVPDTEAPALRFEARLAYRGDERRLTGNIFPAVAGAAGREAGYGLWIGGEAIPLEGGAFRAVTPTASGEVPLAAFRGSRVVATIFGSIQPWFEGSSADMAVLQLDGLRVDP